MNVIGDWQRVRRLGRYLAHDRRRLVLTVLPVSYTHLTLPTKVYV